MSRIRLTAALLTLSCLGLARAADLGVRQDPKLGTILQDSRGMTLYLYTKDTPGVTNCYDQCAAAWPPLLATELPGLPAGMPGKLSLVTRKDGSKQVAYNGWPLYFWVRDTKPGQTTGQGVGKVWYAVNPGPAVQVATLGTLGKGLVAANGMTLYLYTKDTKNVSNCYDQCAVAWPPLLTAYQPTGSAEVQKHLGTTTRKDGSMQVTYDGKPLYFWVRDQKPGDTTGQNVGGVWFIVQP
ncbi:hypothetical protein DAERI_210044 [Deinococcus aerius]|uniref:Lipoprotein n=1 Tax=Deinococcus aerius TaxID=200253 RepID=A0A2I9DN74_9DEIO|nr:hypothetical protein [Deinococcus aerius]GBF08048.1 hypothetical protein DAERI_210044 [Deinococcus aerius]